MYFCFLMSVAIIALMVSLTIYFLFWRHIKPQDEIRHKIFTKYIAAFGSLVIGYGAVIAACQAGDVIGRLINVESLSTDIKALAMDVKGISEKDIGISEDIKGITQKISKQIQMLANSFDSLNTFKAEALASCSSDITVVCHALTNSGEKFEEKAVMEFQSLNPLIPKEKASEFAKQYYNASGSQEKLKILYQVYDFQD